MSFFRTLLSCFYLRRSTGHPSNDIPDDTLSTDSSGWSWSESSNWTVSSFSTDESSESGYFTQSLDSLEVNN